METNCFSFWEASKSKLDQIWDNLLGEDWDISEGIDTVYYELTELSGLKATCCVCGQTNHWHLENDTNPVFVCNYGPIHRKLEWDIGLIRVIDTRHPSLISCCKQNNV